MLRCPRCGCETKIRKDGLEICVNCGVVGQETSEEKSDKTPSYLG